MTSCSPTPFGLELGGVDLHLQLALALAEDRDVRHARDAEEAWANGPSGQHGPVDERHLVRRHPSTITRFADETASMTGDSDTFGSAAVWVSRSDTSWRVRYRSVPDSKIITIDERPGTESERISCRNATPLNRSCSSGTVEGRAAPESAVPERSRPHVAGPSVQVER
jgi:hypothetical protein